jgi:TRAP-type C4-dicarboxylate transport system substrate-binding protein
VKKLMLASLMATALVSAGSISVATAEELNDITLSVVGSWSGLQLHKKYEKPFWTETIPKDSGGRIKVTLTTFDQQGLKGGEVFRLLEKGLFDVGATVADYTVSDAPELEGLDLPMLAPDATKAWEVAKAYKPVLDAALAKRFSAKLISVVPYPEQVVFCNTEISSLADLKGKKVRASGRTTAEFVNALGAEGVTLAFSEVPTALQRGVVDCAITGSLSGYSSGWHEVSSHLYPLPVGGWDHVVTAMRLDVWNGLNKTTQDFLTKEGEAYEAEVWTSAVERTRDGIACLTGNGECTLGEPGAMKLVETQQGDIELANQILRETILPAWSSRVDPEWVKRWNETNGKVVGITAAVN